MIAIQFIELFLWFRILLTVGISRIWSNFSLGGVFACIYEDVRLQDSIVDSGDMGIVDTQHNDVGEFWLISDEEIVAGMEVKVELEKTPKIV